MKVEKNTKERMLRGYQARDGICTLWKVAFYRDVFLVMMGEDVGLYTCADRPPSARVNQETATDLGGDHALQLGSSCGGGMVQARLVAYAILRETFRKVEGMKATCCRGNHTED